jgi:orotidine-5'-phosphate decarboxylase
MGIDAHNYFWQLTKSIQLAGNDTMKTELVVALDLPSRAEAVALVQKLPQTVSMCKIGLELFCAEGPEIVRAVHDLGRRIFLDLKLHDIPRTVERAVTSAAIEGVEWLTVHASGGRNMLQAAANAARGKAAPPKILAVTVLTSLSDADMTDLGINRTAAEQVIALANMALSNGADGLVCSPNELELLRKTFGPAVLLVTPGIRSAGEAANDQKRIATPAFAARAGANAIVVGRPVTAAPDPCRAAQQIMEELRAAGE